MTATYKVGVTIGAGLIVFFVLAAGAWGIFPGLLFGLPWLLIARQSRVRHHTLADEHGLNVPYSEVTSPNRSWKPQNMNNTIMSPAYKQLPQNIFHR